MSNELPCTTWKALTPEQEVEFREYARKNYKAGSPVNVLWHPVYIYECYRINLEAGILKTV